MADGLAAEALTYKGTGYVFGGDGWPPGNWDCSSFVTTMLLRRGLPVPGGGRWGSPDYPPHAHGPSSGDYLSFGTGVATPEAGDLVVWAGEGPNGHIGISLGGDQMISALNPQIGVQETTLATTKGGLMPSAFRRVAGAGGPVPAQAAGGPGVASQPGLVQQIQTAIGNVLTAPFRDAAREGARFIFAHVVVPAALPFLYIAGGIVAIALISWATQAVAGLVIAWGISRASAYVSERRGSSA